MWSLQNRFFLCLVSAVQHKQYVSVWENAADLSGVFPASHPLIAGIGSSTLQPLRGQVIKLMDGKPFLMLATFQPLLHTNQQDFNTQALGSVCLQLIFSYKIRWNVFWFVKNFMKTFHNIHLSRGLTRPLELFPLCFLLTFWKINILHLLLWFFHSYHLGSRIPTQSLIYFSA